MYPCPVFANQIYWCQMVSEKQFHRAIPEGLSWYANNFSKGDCCAISWIKGNRPLSRSDDFCLSARACKKRNKNIVTAAVSSRNAPKKLVIRLGLDRRDINIPSQLWLKTVPDQNLSGAMID